MERLSALINRLKERHEAGCSNEELLKLVEQLKNELSDSVNVFENASPIVSVMMPSGYNPIPTAILHGNTQGNGQQVTSKINDSTTTSLNEEIIVREPPMQHETFIENKIPPIPKPAFKVLRPPLVTVIEEEILAKTETEIVEVILPPTETPVLEEIDFQIEPIAEEEFLLQTETPEMEAIHTNIEATKADDVLKQIETPVLKEIKQEQSIMDEILGFLNFSKPDKRVSPLDFSNEKEEHEEKPLVLELDLKDDSGGNDVQSAKMLQPEKLPFEDVGILELPKERGKPKELHEILAERVVATPSGLHEGKKMLGDSLGSTRIIDLRKGIAINDRFRYIKSLFRGDETLFERSIKTINNFNILAEAQYWIQRELVIKLGWNDEDELVQQFYSLVSRRFL